jgi:hypothetical protein
VKRYILAALACLFITPAQAAFDVGDLVCETSTTTGTGTLNLAGAVSNYLTFVSQIASGNTVPYHIRASDGKLETGIGTFTDATPDTLSRTADWSTDGSGAELTLPAGTHTVCLGPISGSVTNNPMTEDLALNDFKFTGTTAAFATPRQVFGFTSSNDFEAANVNIGSHNYLFWGLESTSTGDGGPYYSTFHNSTSPADNDFVGGFNFIGLNDAGSPVQWQVAAIDVQALDITADEEDGKILFSTTVAGAEATPIAAFAAGAIIGSSTVFPGVGNLRVTNIELGNSDTANTVTCASGNCSVEGNALERAGTQMIYVPAAAMISRATSGADCSVTFDSGAADNTIRVGGVDTTADEWAFFTISMPPRWNEGTVTAQYVWTNTTAASAAETVSIDISCVAIGDTEALNTALGTPINVDDTNDTDLDAHLSAVSGAVTCANTPAANDTVMFGVMRDVSDDNLAGDMNLIGVRLFITTDTANDG